MDGVVEIIWEIRTGVSREKEFDDGIIFFSLDV
jgi:hypothetical protein